MLNEKGKGMLVGLAIGDALGVTLEFTARGSFEPISNIIGGGPFSLQAGKWTDDTSMALCLADSLIEKGGFDAHDQMEKYLDWYRNGYNSSERGCFDIGLTTRNALRTFEKTGEVYCGSENPNTAGNGSIMRLAPVAIKYHNDTDLLMEYAALSSKTTHAAPEAVQSCMLLGLYLQAFLHDKDKNFIFSAEFIQGAQKKIPDMLPNISYILNGSYIHKNEAQINSSGYCIATLESALWAFAGTDNFRDCLLKAVNLGNDSDTVGAVTGQIAGAYYGYSEIPQSWKEILYLENEIAERAEILLID
ncbi:MAG: ADP-ribosylglycohydrolase family protein [Bacteroidales bacterium]|nr:ADP-ribosylglycohydrolase family protein [Bacteroidales bacterium]HOY38814.1 ADP-ribosylglycohydrolase family protein [Bacteroidales bacterium]HQP04952.1 ADP-ribosylglycohydrolase family protein [Bacteroidales bacterium]